MNQESLPTEPQHAKHSPSALHYKEICPGYQNREESSPAAEEGTRLHRAVETGNIDGLDEEQLQVVTICRDFVAAEEAQVSRRIR